MAGPDVGGSGAHKVVARYPAGAQVMVYYNPQKPSEALLERSMPGFIKWFWIALVLTDLFLCGLGAVLAFTLLKQNLRDLKSRRFCFNLPAAFFVVPTTFESLRIAPVTMETARQE